MAKISLFDQLDKAVQAMLATPDAPPSRVDARIAPLVRIAAELRDLPRREFRERLKSELGGKNMATLAEPVAIARQTASPYLVLKNASAAIAFYKNAFGARETLRLAEPGGRIGHAEIVIGNSTIMLSDEYPDHGAVSAETLGGSPVKIHLYVEDVDALGARAVAAGARTLRPITDEFYGERTGQFSDPFGYTWILSTHKEKVSAEEMQKRFDALLRQGAADASRKVNYMREGFHTITPYIAVREAHEVIEFVKEVFGAEGQILGTGSGGGIHAEYRIGDSMVMIGGAAEWKGTPTPTALHVYVANADQVFHKAVKAGATVLRAPADMPYGDREASVKDAGGNHWYIAHHLKSVEPVEGFHTVTTTLHPKGAAGVIDFLQRAFGGEEVFRAESGGMIQHAVVRMGSSVIEMGEAHGEFQPMPTMFYLYVPDTDEVYKRALAAGATSLGEPADHPYGDRNAAVKDPFGNTWYIASRVLKGASESQ
jgi:PhnB protein